MTQEKIAQFLFNYLHQSTVEGNDELPNIDAVTEEHLGMVTIEDLSLNGDTLILSLWDGKEANMVEVKVRTLQT